MNAEKTTSPENPGRTYRLIATPLIKDMLLNNASKNNRLLQKLRINGLSMENLSSLSKIQAGDLIEILS